MEMYVCDDMWADGKEMHTQLNNWVIYIYGPICLPMFLIPYVQRHILCKTWNKRNKNVHSMQDKK